MGSGEVEVDWIAFEDSWRERFQPALRKETPFPESADLNHLNDAKRKVESQEKELAKAQEKGLPLEPILQSFGLSEATIAKVLPFREIDVAAPRQPEILSPQQSAPQQVQAAPVPQNPSRRHAPAPNAYRELDHGHARASAGESAEAPPLSGKDKLLAQLRQNARDTADRQREQDRPLDRDR